MRSASRLPKPAERSKPNSALAEAVAIARRNLVQHPDLAGVIEEYSVVLKKQGKTKEAAELRAEAKRARVTAGMIINFRTLF
jgi:hypothetical protein